MVFELTATKLHVHYTPVIHVWFTFKKSHKSYMLHKQDIQVILISHIFNTEYTIIAHNYNIQLYGGGAVLERIAVALAQHTGINKEEQYIFTCTCTCIHVCPLRLHSIHLRETDDTASTATCRFICSTICPLLGPFLICIVLCNRQVG